MASASLDDVATGLGRPLSEGAEQDQVNQWIDDAELLIRVKLGSLDALDQDVLAFVVREAVLARMRNPEGYQSETIDDYTYRWDASSRRVSITEEWWHMLNPETGSGTFSVRPSFEPDTSSDGYVWTGGPL